MTSAAAPARTIAECRTVATVDRMLAAAAGRWLARRARGHLQDGLPQLAVFAFDHIGRQVVLAGRYERDELELLAQCAGAWLHPQATVLDIGANVGNHALFFAERCAEVWAFEPNPRTYALLALNSSLRPNIRCFAQAASDRVGEAALTVPAHNVGMATLDQGAAGDAVVRVPTVRIDAVPGLAERRVSLVKIDVEGHEAAVLRGAAALLARDKPLVVFEQRAGEIGADGHSAATAVLREAGYTRWWVTQAFPRETRWRPLNWARRLAGSEGLRMVEVSRLEPRFHSMVVAVPS